MRLPGNSNSECLPGLHSHSVPAGCQVPPRPLIRLSCDTFPGGPRGTALPCMSSQCSIDYEEQAVPNSPAHNGVYTIFRIEGRFSDLRDGNRKAGRSPKGDRPTLDWSVYFLRELPLAGVNQCIALGSSGLSCQVGRFVMRGWQDSHWLGGQGCPDVLTLTACRSQCVYGGSPHCGWKAGFGRMGKGWTGLVRSISVGESRRLAGLPQSMAGRPSEASSHRPFEGPAGRVSGGGHPK